MCGGDQVNPFADHVTNCFRYNPNDDTWAISVDLNHKHFKSGYTSHSTLGLVICGEKDDASTADKCETTLDGNVMQVGTEPGS